MSFWLLFIEVVSVFVIMLVDKDYFDCFVVDELFYMFGYLVICDSEGDFVI